MHIHEMSRRALCFIAGLLAVERTTSILLNNLRYRPPCGAQSSDEQCSLYVQTTHTYTQADLQHIVLILCLLDRASL